MCQSVPSWGASSMRMPKGPKPAGTRGVLNEPGSVAGSNVLSKTSILPL